jgi:hypothetical protein
LREKGKGKMQLFPRNFLWAGIFLGLLWGAMGGVAGGQEKEMFELKSFQWENRILLIFAPSAEDPVCRSLAAELNAQIAGVRERDLLIGEFFEAGANRFAGASLAPESAEALRRQFSVRKGTPTVILIGKDGEVKLRREGSVQAAEIFALIDSMPMRQKEMGGRK